MPNGEFRPDRKVVRTSGVPSLSASRTRVMRLAEGTVAPARPMMIFSNQPLMPLPSSGLGGAFVSAISTSPLGST
jgi:hypothetical protein